MTSDDPWAPPLLEGVPRALLPGRDDPTYRAVVDGARAVGLRPEQFRAIAAPVIRARAMEALPDYQAEVARIGSNGPAVVAAVSEWLRQLVATQRLTHAEAAALRGISTAEGVRGLAKLHDAIAAKEQSR